MADDFPCKYCLNSICEDCPNEEIRKSFDTSLLRQYISGLNDEIKIPFIEQILREEGLEPI